MKEKKDINTNYGVSKGIDANKLFICLYIIIGLLLINTIVLSFKEFGTVSKETTPSGNESGLYYTEEDVKDMTEVGIADILKVFEEKEKTVQVLYIGRPTCSACGSFMPTLKNAQSKFGYKTLYLDIEKVDSKSEDFTKFITKLDKDYEMDGTTDTFGNFYGYTPMVVLIKDGKMLDGVIGALSQDSFYEFLNENGFK